MPAEIETAVLADTKAWWGGDKIFDTTNEPMTIERIFEAEPVFAAKVESIKFPITLDTGAIVDAEDYRANVRREYDLDHVKLNVEPKLLGIVKAGYKIFQPFHQAELLTDLLASGELELESALSLRGGSVTVLLARLPDNVVIAGDETAQYVAIVNSYDASYSLTVVFTPIRIVCQNTLNMALSRAKRIFRVRHLGRMEIAIQDVRTALGMTHKYVDALSAYATEMSKKKLTKRQADRFVEILVPVPDEVMRVKAKDGEKDATEEARLANKRAIDNALKLREKIREIEGTTDHLANHRGTGWGWLQAVSTYMDHEKNYRSAESKFMLTLGDPRNILTDAQRALAEVVAR